MFLTVQQAEAVILGLAHASRLCRHAGFRLIYFGKDSDYRNNVRYFIEYRLFEQEFRDESKISDADIERLVELFCSEVRVSELGDDGVSLIVNQLPEVFGRIAC
jgi:hypothetical protein